MTSVSADHEPPRNVGGFHSFSFLFLFAGLGNDFLALEAGRIVVRGKANTNKMRKRRVFPSSRLC